MAKRSHFRRFLFFYSMFLVATGTQAQVEKVFVLKPERVFDGTDMHTGWVVVVSADTLAYAGPSASLPDIGSKGQAIALPGKTILPGLIEGHSHLFLHPYNETPWDDQVLKESRAERTARAVNHARNTLRAGFTTVRDLGTEGASYDDVGLKAAIRKGVIPGPNMLVATRAIVATGSYGPRSASDDVSLPKGAAEADGIEGLTREIREQIGKGADIIKLYGDYRWGRSGEAMPTFTAEEMALAVRVAGSSGRQVVVHASTAEGMRRAISAGVSTIEHGDNGDPSVFALMKQRGVALCPTLAAGDAIERYRGWDGTAAHEPARLAAKRLSFRQALEAGVTICMGGDVGVFAHGENAREMELMVDYGMKPMDVLRSATSVNADVFGISDKAGRIRRGLPADLVIVEGDPSTDMKNLRRVVRVYKAGHEVE
jgi:imidazolonepropionase-like amidohydrolase